MPHPRTSLVASSCARRGHRDAVARSLGLTKQFEWNVWCEEGMWPPSVPSHPDQTDKGGGWQGWGHWLGSGAVRKASKFAPFGQALAFAQSLGLASQKEWKVWCKEGVRPSNVPSNPQRTYDGGWQGWGHWLSGWAAGTSQGRWVAGAGPLAGHRQSGQLDSAIPAAALRVARQLRFVSSMESLAWCRSGARPANLDQVYVHDGWTGWVHWPLWLRRSGHGTASAGQDYGRSLGRRPRRVRPGDRRGHRWASEPLRRSGRGQRRARAHLLERPRG